MIDLKDLTKNLDIIKNDLIKIIEETSANMPQDERNIVNQYHNDIMKVFSGEMNHEKITELHNTMAIRAKKDFEILEKKKNGN